MRYVLKCWGQTGIGHVPGKFSGERKISALYHLPHTVSATLTNTVTPASTLHCLSARGVNDKNSQARSECVLWKMPGRYPDKEERWRWAYCDVCLWACSKQVKHVLRKEGWGEECKVLHQKIGVQWPLYMIFLMRLPLNLKSSGGQQIIKLGSAGHTESLWLTSTMPL